MPEAQQQSQLLAALKRSWLVIVVCVIVGLALMGILHSARKAQFTASSDVYIAEQDLSSLVLGVGISDDPNRDIANDLQLATSINYQANVAAQFAKASGQGYDEKEVEAHLAVTNDGEDDVIKFTATAGSGHDATLLANTAVASYGSYRAQVLSQPIISALEAGGATVSNTKRLNLLKRLNENSVIISKANTAAPEATLSKDLAIGLIAGLVVGLLLMALREAVPRLAPVQSSTPERSRPLQFEPDPVSASGSPPPVRVREVPDRRVAPESDDAAGRLRRRATPRAETDQTATAVEPAAEGGRRTGRRGLRLPEPEVRPSTRGRNGNGNGSSSAPDGGADQSPPSGRRGR